MGQLLHSGCREASLAPDASYEATARSVFARAEVLNGSAAVRCADRQTQERDRNVQTTR